MKKFFKYFFGTIAILLLLAQLYPRPVKNESATVSLNDIGNKYPVPANVEAVLKVACYDCHTSNTVYPWYSKIQPVSMWLGNHIKDGKRHLNFSEFLSYRIAKQYHKLEEVEETVEEGEMPLSSYTIIHRDAKLTEAQKRLLIEWSRSVRDSLKATYPADSLVLPKRKK